MVRRSPGGKHEIGVVIHADNRTAAGLRSAAAQVRAFSGQISTQAGYTAGALSAATAGMTAGLVAGAGAVIMFGREGLKEFAKLEQKIVEVQTLLSGLETDTRRMTSSAQRLSMATGQSGEDIAAGWYTAVSAGVDFNESLIVVGESAIGAAAGLTDLETSTRASAAGMNAFGESAQSTQDKAFAAVKLGVVQYENIASAVGKFAGTGAAANLELAEMLSGLTTLTVQGVQSEEGVVQINNAVNQLLKSGSQAGKLFQDLAGQSFPEFTAQGGTLAQAVKMIGDEAQRTGKSIFDLIPEARAARGFQLLFDNMDTWQAHNREIADSAGAAAEAHDQMAATTQTALDRMGQGWDSLKQRIGEAAAAAAGFAGFLPDALTAQDIRVEAATEQWKQQTLEIEAATEALKYYDVTQENMGGFMGTGIGRSEGYETVKRLEALFDLIAEHSVTFGLEWKSFDQYAASLEDRTDLIASDLLEQSESLAESRALTEQAGTWTEAWAGHLRDAADAAADVKAQLTASVVAVGELSRAEAAYAAGRGSGQGAAAASDATAAALRAADRRTAFAGTTEQTAAAVAAIAAAERRTGGRGGGGGFSDIAGDLDRARSAYARGGPIGDLISALEEHQSELDAASVAFLRVGDEIHRLEQTQTDLAARAEKRAEAELDAIEDFTFQMSAQSEADLLERRDLLRQRQTEFEKNSENWRAATGELKQIEGTLSDLALSQAQQAAEGRQIGIRSDILAIDRDWDRFLAESMTGEQLRTILRMVMGIHGFSEVGLHARRVLRRLDEHEAEATRRKKEAHDRKMEKLAEDQLKAQQELNKRLPRVMADFDPGSSSRVPARADGTLRQVLRQQTARQGNRLVTRGR